LSNGIGAGTLSRRALLRRAAGLGLATPLTAAVLAACGGATSSTATAGTTASTTATGSSAATAGVGTGAPGAAASPVGSAGTLSAASGWKPRQLSVKLTGSGSSFVDPAMQSWIKAYQKLAPNVSINYQSVGSGQGKKDFIGGITTFAGSDAPMTDAEMQQAPGSIHLPDVIGAVTVLYNLPGADKLQFSGETIAGIFQGKITTWNDPKIAADNSGAKLSNTPITVVHRSDGSGTTAIFTDYLSKVSPDWKSAVGSGTTVSWPVGVGAQQSPGVTAAVQQTPGAISYVELIYALQNNLPTPSVKNSSGKFVVPTLESSAAAAAAYLNNIPADMRVFITNPSPGDDAYPITGFSWLIIHPTYTDATTAQALTDFLYWALTDGQTISQQLKYAPIPAPVQQREIQQLSQVKAGGQPAFQAPA